MSEPRPVRTFPWGLPLWVWVVGALLLVLASLYGSLWLPELRERMAVRYLSGLPGCELEKVYPDSDQTPRWLSTVLPDHPWLEWLHRLEPDPPELHSFSINNEFPLAELKRLRSVRRLWQVDACDTDLNDEHLSHISTATSLNLDGTQVGDAGLAHLRRTPLVELSVANTRVGDAGIGALKNLEELWLLDVSGTAIGNAGMEALARNASGGSLPLMLCVSQTALGDDAMEFVSRIHRLKHLDLSETHVTDAGLVRLAAMPEMNITSLILDRTQIGDEGLRALLAQDHPSNFDLLSLSGTRVTWEYIETWNSAPEELRLAGLDIRDRAANWFAEHGGHCLELDLSDTRLTDLGLAALEKCARLRRLCVKTCEISEAAAVHFMQSSPTAPSPRLGRTPSRPLADRIQRYRETGWLER